MQISSSVGFDLYLNKDLKIFSPNEQMRLLHLLHIAYSIFYNKSFIFIIHFSIDENTLTDEFSRSDYYKNLKKISSETFSNSLHFLSTLSNSNVMNILKNGRLASQEKFCTFYNFIVVKCQLFGPKDLISLYGEIYKMLV